MAKKTFPIVAIQKTKRETEVSRRLINFVLLMYNQLTLAQRYTISAMRQNGSSLQAIADELNRLREEEAALKGNTAPAKRLRRLPSVANSNATVTREAATVPGWQMRWRRKDGSV